ncbi:LOW QUALITY PROTEIN: inositol-tetrakisphosphate 1-kinase 2-like [Prosopis cineraria]|uniref:LOW QUALITY PROTEIN: inositol-tetrakisphosphate 1-kinase 2-like n=1 Tax=Prosopis cineraria TaxID=364024 RepID=UPI00240FCCB9|nr:LOW QUALITY PROTEIN: inositol-tetrakisphosphate 1-kinase 2-like [Prosopis cineraria]
MSAPESHRYRIGYALEPKKVQSFILKPLLDCANERRIDLIHIDLARSLIEQGPFDCIIHKLYGQDWKKQLDEFSAAYPKTVIIDSPELIERLHNRVSMLEVVNQINIPLENDTIGIPKQRVIQESKALDDANAIEELGLNFPLIAKPLEANGGPNSHNLSLVFDHSGLKTLSIPVVLQEFVNHGGVIFKIYVAGQHISCVKRKSLPDIPQEKWETMSGALPFSRISNLAVQDNSHTENDDSAQNNVEKAEMPPESLIVGLARAMKEAMGLNLFNVDAIRDARDRTRYLVIDVNYFPGYAKLPTYESFFTKFLWDIVHHKRA